MIQINISYSIFYDEILNQKCNILEIIIYHSLIHLLHIKVHISKFPSLRMEQNKHEINKWNRAPLSKYSSEDSLSNNQEGIWEVQPKLHLQFKLNWVVNNEGFLI